MGSVIDFMTFDVFDMDKSREFQVPQVNMPGMSADERALIKLQTDALRKSLAPPSDEEQAVIDRMNEYQEQILSDEILSEDEEAMFNEEYELQVQALEEQFQIETTKQGGTRMADLVSRGVLETTTGQDIIASDQQRFSSMLGEGIAELGTSKEIAKSDMEAAKMDMAQKGYQLTSGLIQVRQNDALQMAGQTQNFLAGQRNMRANVALQNSLMNQQYEQWKYQEQMAGWSSMIGVGQGMMKGGGMGG